MEAKLGRTTGNIKQDHVVFGQAGLLARQKYDQIRAEENRRNGVMSVRQGLACITFWVVAVTASNTGNPLGDFVGGLLGTQSTISNTYPCPK